MKVSCPRTKQIARTRSWRWTTDHGKNIVTPRILHGNIGLFRYHAWLSVNLIEKKKTFRPIIKCIEWTLHHSLRLTGFLHIAIEMSNSQCGGCFVNVHNNNISYFHTSSCGISIGKSPICDWVMYNIFKKWKFVALYSYAVIRELYYLVIFDHISDMRCFEVYINNDYSWLLLCRLYVEMLVLIIWCWRHLRVWSIISSANVWQISMSWRWVAFIINSRYFRWDQYFFFFFSPNKISNNGAN